MTKQRKIPGQWWFPETPTEKWIGTLTLAPNKDPELRVTIRKGPGHKLESCPPVLHGCDQHGKPITLLFASHINATESAVLSRHTYSAGYAVLGVLLREPAELSFNSLHLQLQHLYEWSGITGFVRTEAGMYPDVHIHYHHPEDQSFAIDSDLSVQVQSTYSSHQGRPEQYVRESLCVGFISKRGLNLKQCLDLINAFRHLLHFAILKPVFPLQITAEKDGYGDTLDGHFFPNEIELRGALIKEPVESEPSWISERWMFQFKDVQQDFGKFMAKWLDYVNTFDEALGCYFTTVYHRLTHEVEHLCLTQAFEAYHGTKFASHKEHAFEDKVRELAELNKPSLRGLVDDVADFATTVVHNRNYYTHHNPKWKQDGRVVSGAKLYRLNEKLRLIFQMCVLADMGIPADRFARLRRQLASQIIEYS